MKAGTLWMEMRKGGGDGRGQTMIGRSEVKGIHGEKGRREGGEGER